MKKNNFEKKSLCFAKTKTKHQFKNRKKNTSLQKTENLSPLKKIPLTEKHTHLLEKATFFLKQQTTFSEETTLIKKKHVLEKNYLKKKKLKNKTLLGKKTF